MRLKMATELMHRIEEIDKAENHAMAVYYQKRFKLGILPALKLAAIEQEAFSFHRKVAIIEYGKKLHARAVEPSHNARRAGR